MRTRGNIYVSTMIASILFIATLAGMLAYVTSLPFYERTARTVTITEKLSSPQDAQEKAETENPFETAFKQTAVKYTQQHVPIEGQKAMEKQTEPVVVKAEHREVPINYTEIHSPQYETPLYAFVDRNGDTQYRVMIQRDRKGKKERGFIKATLQMQNTSIVVDYNPGDDIVDPAKEDYGEITLKEAPSDMIGNLMSEYGKTGVYYRLKNGLKEYVCYGSYPGKEDGFYMADQTGRMIPGTLSISTNSEEGQ